LATEKRGGKDLEENKIDLNEQEIEELREKKKQERVSKCLKEINEALDRYNCFLDVSLTLTTPNPQNPNGIKFTINVLAR
jgi:hypothetical protein